MQMGDCSLRPLRTSMKMPSTPATTAVRAMVGMSSRSPPLATPPPSSARPVVPPTAIDDSYRGITDEVTHI
jgi:hypothetical protein